MALVTTVTRAKLEDPTAEVDVSGRPAVAEFFESAMALISARVNQVQGQVQLLGKERARLDRLSEQFESALVQDQEAVCERLRRKHEHLIDYRAAAWDSGLWAVSALIWLVVAVGLAAADTAFTVSAVLPILDPSATYAGLTAWCISGCCTVALVAAAEVILGQPSTVTNQDAATRGLEPVRKWMIAGMAILSLALAYLRTADLGEGFATEDLALYLVAVVSFPGFSVATALALRGMKGNLRSADEAVQRQGNAFDGMRGHEAAVRWSRSVERDLRRTRNRIARLNRCHEKVVRETVDDVLRDSVVTKALSNAAEKLFIEEAIETQFVSRADRADHVVIEPTGHEPTDSRPNWPFPTLILVLAVVLSTTATGCGRPQQPRTAYASWFPEQQKTTEESLLGADRQPKQALVVYRDITRSTIATDQTTEAARWQEIADNCQAFVRNAPDGSTVEVFVNGPRAGAPRCLISERVPWRRAARRSLAKRMAESVLARGTQAVAEELRCRQLVQSCVLEDLYTVARRAAGLSDHSHLVYESDLEQNSTLLKEQPERSPGSMRRQVLKELPPARGWPEHILLIPLPHAEQEGDDFWSRKEARIAFVASVLQAWGASDIKSVQACAAGPPAGPR